MIIKQVSYENNLEDIKYFFNVMCGNSKNTFSYFSKREFIVIKNHLLTNLVFEDKVPIAYSHIDTEDDCNWLGICVGENYIGKKIGNFLLNETLNQAKELNIDKVNLSVYKNNTNAINLYKKFNFVVYNENKESYFMKRDL